MKYFLVLTCGFLLGCDATATGPGGSAPAPETVEDVVEVSENSSADVVPDEASLRPAIKAGPTRTVAGLGDPSRQGLWLETPLVTAQVPGRVRVVSSGVSAQVTLIPLAAEETAGSFLSLEAMRALKAPLTDLVELEVSVSG